MPSEGVKIELAYLLRDPNTGVAVVPDLFHLHESTWTVRALLAGYPGSTTIGDFTIRLPAPYSEEYKSHASQYAAILNASNAGIGLKVEGYQGSVNAGAPVVSGVITKMNLPLDGPWELIGSDTLIWLQQSQLLPGEIFAAPMDGVLPTGTLEIVQALSCTQEVVWDDDFTNWGGGGTGHTSADYTLSNFSFTSSDPVNSLPALTSTAITPTDAYTVTSGSWGKLVQYCYSQVSIHGTIVAGSSASNAGEASIYLFADGAAANGVLIQAFLVAASGVLYNLNVAIYTKLSGAYTSQASASGVFTNVASPFPFEIAAVLYENAGVNEIRIIVNGKDTGCVASGVTVPATGRIGLRFSAQSGGSPAVYVNRIQFHARTQPLGAAWSPPRFAAGVQVNDGASINQQAPGNNATHLDMLVLAATLGGSQLRKNPGVGAKADSLDYSASPGVDRSAQIVFEEKDNVVANGTTLQNTAELYANETRVNAVPATDSGGTVTWGRIGASGDMVLTDSISDIGAMSYALLIAYAKQVAGRKLDPLTATQVRVVRTVDLLKANAGWGPRECDFVTVNLPTYGVNRQRAQIVGYTITEGDDTVLYFVTQFPESRLAQAALQRIVRSLDYLSQTYQHR